MGQHRAPSRSADRVTLVLAVFLWVVAIGAGFYAWAMFIR